jgi:phage terminase large subunit-like protein
MDPFLNEIHAIHDLRGRIRELSDGDRAKVAETLGETLADSWALTARDSQLPPRHLGWCWIFVGGRGTGKTRALSGCVHAAIRSGLKRLHYIAPTTGDIHAVSVEGPAGIMSTIGEADDVPRWVPSKRRLEWPNGAICTFFSGEEPEALRGPQCEIAFIDELARMTYQQQAFDMCMLGLRLGQLPRVLIATTPRPTPLFKKLVQMEGTTITRGSTWDNASNLAASFIEKIRELYEGTRLGRQELEGHLLLDPPNALFKDDWFKRETIDETTIEQVTVGVDPAGSSGGDQAGIVVAALLNDGRYAVLADRTCDGTPAIWGDAAVKAADDFAAEEVCVELNFGGSMAIEVVKQAAERAFAEGRRPTNMIRIREVTASRGKAMRAEPVSLLYEKGRVIHAPGLKALEEEMLSFHRDYDRKVDGSPNRLDAAVWSLTRLSKVVLDLPMA